MTGLLILAGGEAKRLKNKMFLKISNKEMIRFVYDSFKNFELEEIAIAIKQKHLEQTKKIFKDELNKEKLKLLVDEIEDYAPIYGVLNMEKMRSSKIFLTSGDSLFGSKIYTKISKNIKDMELKNYDAIIPIHKFIEPLNALYKREKILNACKIAIKNSKLAIKDALTMLNVYYIKFNSDEFININTIEDFKKFLEQSPIF